MLWLITIFCLGFAILSYFKTNWALYLIIAMLPSYLIRFTIFGMPVTLLEAMILILFLAWIINKKSHWRDIYKNPFFWPIIAIIIFASLSVWKSPDTIKALGIWKAYFIEPIIFFFITSSIIKNKAQLKNIFWALGVSALYLSIIAIWQKFTGWNIPEPYMIGNTVDRVVSIFNYPNALGLYLGPIIILFGGFILWSKDNGIKQVLKILVIGLSIITIVLAKSEAALLSILIIFIIWALFQKKLRWAVGVLILIAIVAILINPMIGSFITDKITLQDYSGMIRLLIWTETWEMLQDNWFWGAGLNGYQVAIAPYHLPTFEIFMYPHNIIFNFWSELGLLGFLSFIWLILIFLWNNIRTIFNFFGERRILALTLLLVFIQIVIHGLVDVPYFKNDLSILFWIIMSITIIQNKIAI